MQCIYIKNGCKPTAKISVPITGAATPATASVISKSA